MATVERMPDGTMVLNDPEALGVARAVGKHNCKATLDLNADRVEYFRGRFATQGYSAATCLIVIANVDDANGSVLADALMPDHDWNQFRAKGETPFARGIAPADLVAEFLKIFDQEAYEKLPHMLGIRVVVVDHGVAEVF